MQNTELDLLGLRCEQEHTQQVVRSKGTKVHCAERIKMNSVSTRHAGRHFGQWLVPYWKVDI